VHYHVKVAFGIQKKVEYLCENESNSLQIRSREFPSAGCPTVLFTKLSDVTASGLSLRGVAFSNSEIRTDNRSFITKGKLRPGKSFELLHCSATEMWAVFG
jgi:hypothetical protein